MFRQQRVDDALDFVRAQAAMRGSWRTSNRIASAPLVVLPRIDAFGGVEYLVEIFDRKVNERRHFAERVLIEPVAEIFHRNEGVHFLAIEAGAGIGSSLDDHAPSWTS